MTSNLYASLPSLGLRQFHIPPPPAPKKPTRWTHKLGQRYCTVSSYFLENYHRLGSESGQPGARGLNSIEAMLIIQILDFKWDGRLPFPTVGTLARRLGVSSRHVRDTLKTLEERGYVNRISKGRGAANQYDVDGLYKALETLMASDIATTDKKSEVAA